MTKRPPQVTCHCHLRAYPHREDQYCRELRDEQGADEYADERRYIDRDRAADVRAVNRRVK